jgi:hypothetical protein
MVATRGVCSGGFEDGIVHAVAQDRKPPRGHASSIPIGSSFHSSIRLGWVHSSLARPDP